MKKQYVRRMSSIFYKILALFLMVIFPLYFSSLLINLLGRNEIWDGNTKLAKSRLDFYASRLERDFLNVKQAVDKLFVNQELQSLSLVEVGPDNRLEYYKRGKAMLAIMERMNEIADMSPFISEVDIYIPLTGKRISNFKIQKMDWLEFDQFLRSVKESRNTYSVKYISPGVRTELTNPPNPGIYLCTAPLFSDIVIQKRKVPPYLIALKINKSEIEGVLREFAENLRGNAVLVSGGKGLDILPGREEDIIKLLKERMASPAYDVNHSPGISSVEGRDGRYVVAAKRVEILDSTLMMYNHENRFFGSLKLYQAWFWAVTFLTVLIVLLFSLWVRKVVMKPLIALVGAFSRVEEGDLEIKLEYRKGDEFGYLYQRFNKMCIKIKMLIEQVYEQRIRIQGAELKQLQYQINPHFLYNSLFSIYRMAESGDNDNIMKLSEHLGSYYRFITRGMPDEVAFSAEMEHARDYVEVQSIRYAGRISAEMDEIPEGCGEIKVPRLIIQPLIENAYHHGLKNKLSDGVLRVKIIHHPPFLRVLVEDNGESITEEKIAQLREILASSDDKAESTGLLNIHRRIRIVFGMDSGINVFINDMKGMSAELRIKYGG